ncbi:hypothetical protein F4677DRAFT_430374 [Hypoxylon crocopeplum]|nr:hypothetical protein F4677DRAFT_430374 [Hypoxylon crocopeplum]
MAAVLKPSEPLNHSLTTDNTGAADEHYTRLHITPLNESLLGVVVPSSVLPRARNISYHTIETFPEKQYGFVDLPAADADKIKKKLNGAVLRGTKMRIEKAKPESIPEPTGEANDSKSKKEKKKSKKRKREVGVTPGVELEDRKIKRGWTISEQEMIEEKRKKSKKDKKDKKSKDEKDGKKKKKGAVKSKYTDNPECLFKTKLPDAGSSSKPTEEATEHKKKRKSDREVVIHEFEKTVKYPSFLKSNTEKTNSEPMTFEDGVGWVDEKGTVVEPIVNKRSHNNTSKSNTAKSKSSKPTPVVVEDDDTSSSNPSSDDSEATDQDMDSSDDNEDEVKTAPKKLMVETQTLGSPASLVRPDSARPKSSGSVTSLTIKIPPVTPASAKVHPLEALYKRPKGDTAAPGGNAQEAEPFSFFGDNDDDIEEDNVVPRRSHPPMTPFTKQDFDFRNVRSAAPTPDTAHPSRTFNLWPRQGSSDRIDEDEEDEDDHGGQGDHDEDTAMADVSNKDSVADGDNQTPVSDFQKQFWESRGDLNRSWRKRRKAASKEKRYRENRARAERAI